MDKKEFSGYIKAIKLFIDELDFLQTHLDAIAPGGNCELGEKFIEAYIDLLANHVGDRDKWIEWYVWDNKFGKNKYEAGYDGEHRKIKNADDLWALIIEGQNKR